ncbi:glycosyltransferase [Postechiella marina]|uniref:Glycosyltransferase n=1 Tax=Postechiella marina TaxID=943941 RepID=A0ABP8CD92_9FLAO
MQNLLISILIPFKNTENFIAECVTSIIKQNYTNWELLIVDDGSTDSSYTIVKKLADKDLRINLLKNPGKGIIDALKFAFKTSKGKLITRMDSDDVMSSNKLNVLANSLLKHGKQHVALGLVNYFSKDGIKDGYKNYEIWLNNLTKTGSNYSEIYKECVIPSPCWMVYREDLEACGAFNFNTYPEDYDLAFRFYKHNFKCISCNEVIHNWRDYSSRASRTDEHYAENHFIPLKLNYFLDLDFDKNKTLILWGAGKKGKQIAKYLINKKINFEWICDNPNKIGHNIYGKILKPTTFLNKNKNTQSIITVANKTEQSQILDHLKSLDKKNIEDYVFFC